MDTNKMREEFEAAFVAEQVRLLGEGFRSSAIYMISQNVVTVRSAWWAWQASRAAVVVEVPNEIGDAPRECRDGIEAAGLRWRFRP
ncbi:hypothetical protein [Pseudomonas phoenicis]|uniref:hypothetical protein n=1 Tax=unclassified Pseudomonas TaxID=196821 RepID=UPI0039A0D2BD